MLRIVLRDPFTAPDADASRHRNLRLYPFLRLLADAAAGFFSARELRLQQRQPERLEPRALVWPFGEHLFFLALDERHPARRRQSRWRIFRALADRGSALRHCVSR